MPDMEGFATVRAYVEAGLGPADDPYRATYLMEHLGLTGEELITIRGLSRVYASAVDVATTGWRREMLLVRR